MEKYSRFRDEGTGIAPFQEARPNSQDFNILQKVVIFLISLVMFVLSGLNLALYLLLAKWAIPGLLSRFLLQWFVFVPLRLFNTTLSYEGERRASVRKKSIRKAEAGDVVLCNFVSPLDPLVFESQRLVHFAFPTKDRKFERVTTYTAMIRAISAPTASVEGISLQSISEDAAECGAIVVVFVEGMTSNGRGLLTLKNLNAQDIAKIDKQIYAGSIKYTPMTATSPIPQSPVNYIWNILNASWWYVTAVKISGEPLAKATLSPDQIAKTIAGLGRLRLLGERLDAQTKIEYIKQKKA